MTRIPRWMSLRTVVALHQMCMELDGGATGLRDAGRLASALARPEQAWHDNRPALVQLAALYAHGIARNHPFVDGNKRTAFLAAATFLEKNGLRVVASQGQAAVFMVALAEGSLDAEAFALWLGDKTRSKTRRKPRPAGKPRKKDG